MTYTFDDHLIFEGFSDPETDRSILKDSIGRYRTNLFLEFNKTRHEYSPPIYTMRELPHKGLLSAYLIYMNSDSEYEAALKLVGSWQHWEKLLKSKAFLSGADTGQWTGVQAWRDEKETRDRAVAYNQLRVNAAQGHVQAQKMIFDGKTSASKRGRPSREEVLRVAKEQAEYLDSTKKDLQRIKLVVNGTIKRHS